MIWPFLLIYVSEKLSLPMAAVTSLMTLNSLAGLASSIVAGSLIDRFGRRVMMALGLFGSALVYAGYLFASSFWHFGVLLFLASLFTPLYRVGADALLSDLVAPEQRAQAFGLARMGRNIGVALGPLIGGLVLTASYAYGLLGAAAALALFGLITLFFVRETLPQDELPLETLREQLSVYRKALSEPRFTRMLSAYTLMEICAALIWVLLAVCLKQNFDIGEARYGLIASTNAVMVVFLQVFITRRTQKHPPTRVMPLGALLYAAAMLVVAVSNGFWGFWSAMVILTLGELLTAPTASAYVVNMAPPAQRGRYLGLFGLTWQAATAIGPLAAGFLSDAVSMRAPWVAGALVGLASAAAFLALDRYSRTRALAN